MTLRTRLIEALGASPHASDAALIEGVLALKTELAKRGALLDEIAAALGGAPVSDFDPRGGARRVARLAAIARAAADFVEELPVVSGADHRAKLHRLIAAVTL